MQVGRLLQQVQQVEYAHQRAAALDPTDARSYAGLADSYYALSTGDKAPLEVMPKAKAAALKAIALDDTVAEAHASLGQIAFFYDWDAHRTEQEFRKALALEDSPGGVREAGRFLLDGGGVQPASVNNGVIPGPRMQVATRALDVTGAYPLLGYAPNVEVPHGVQVVDGPDEARKAVREQISSAINLIVHQERMRDGSRKVVSITEVSGMEGDVITTQDLFVYEITDEDENGNILGHHRSTGIGRPRFWERARYYGEEKRLAAAIDAAEAAAPN